MYLMFTRTEINEAEAVVALCPLQGDKFSYALANGIVGVYSGQERFWRIKVSGSVSNYLSLKACRMNIHLLFEN